MARLVLILLLAIFVARAFWRFVDGIVAGASNRASAAGVPGRGVQMARDPVCGTFVVPDRAVRLADGRHDVFFCSAACRDKYRSRTA